MELSQELRSILDQAEEIVLDRGLEYATPELVLFCMLDSSVIYHF